MVIVQAKTNKRPLHVNAVGEFTSVIKDVRATKGVMICNSGFTRSAQKYAFSLGVDLCSAHHAESRDWRMLLKLPVFWLRLTTNLRCELTLELKADDFVSAEFPNWRFSTDGGSTQFSLWERFQERWNSNLLPTTAEEDHTFEASCVEEGVGFLPTASTQCLFCTPGISGWILIGMFTHWCLVAGRVCQNPNLGNKPLHPIEPATATDST